MKALLITTNVLFIFFATHVFAAPPSNFEKTATEAVKRIMKDPESTQFRDLREIKNLNGNSVLCGEVNSKNSYGGYTGYSYFSYSEEGISIINLNDRSYRANIELNKYERSGCDGEKSEKVARNPDMFKNYCEVTHQLFEDVFADKKTREDAIERALSDYQSKGLMVFNSDLIQVKSDLLMNLDETAKVPEAIKIIAKKDKAYKRQYSAGCPNLMKQLYLK